MSKYTEAILRLKDHFAMHDDGRPTPCLDEAARTAYYALKLADRLEQAITDEQTADCIIVDVECVNNKHDKEVWLNGYNQALADIRGDTE